MGVVFNIQKFCISDGPGIRTTVFLKGCPLNCDWCHNPESHSIKPQLLFSKDGCAQCGACGSVCKNGVHSFKGFHTLDRTKCTACGDCVDQCGGNLLELAGKDMSAEAVIDEVLGDKPFYETSGGGLTVSGGEPLMQPLFTLEILRLAKQNGIHTAVETSGYADFETIQKIAKYTDLFLYDYKITDCELHKELTGVGNRTILENLQKLDGIGAKIILRCPIIPSINDNEAHFSSVAKTANSLKNILAIEVLPYHNFGVSKREKLGALDTEAPYCEPKKEQVDEWLEKISKQTKTPVKKA